MRGERSNALRHRHDDKQSRFYKKKKKEGLIKNVEDHLELAEAIHLYWTKTGVWGNNFINRVFRANTVLVWFQENS